MKILILNLSADKMMKNDILKGAKGFDKEGFEVICVFMISAGLVELRLK